MRLFGSCLVFLFMLVPAGGERPRSSAPSLRAVGYYIAVRAELNGNEIDIFGASNLPPGSILGILIYQFLGSNVANDETNVVVGDDGLFRTAIHSKKGVQFRHSMVCDVVFAPTYPRQPAEVLKVVGKVGERLGKWDSNPQLDGNPRVTTLYTQTIVN